MCEDDIPVMTGKDYLIELYEKAKKYDALMEQQSIQQSKLNGAVQEVIDFCWDENGWVGTETIRKSGQFLKRMGHLRDVFYGDET